MVRRMDGWCHLCHPACKPKYVHFGGMLDALGNEASRIKCLNKQQGSDALSMVYQHVTKYGTYLCENLPPGWIEELDHAGCRQYECLTTGQTTDIRPFWHQTPQHLTRSQERLAWQLVKCLENKYRKESATWSISGAISALRNPSVVQTSYNAMYLDDALYEMADAPSDLQKPSHKPIRYAEAVAATMSTLAPGRLRFVVGQKEDMWFPGGVRYFICASMRTLEEWVDSSSFRRRGIRSSSSSDNLARQMLVITRSGWEE